MDDPEALPPDPKAARRLGLALLGVVALGVAMYFLLLPPRGHTPGAIERVPLLARGREIYIERCQGCHGPTGHGDGPIAMGISGPSPGDLTDGKWKYGRRPEDITKVIREGIPSTAMAGWKVIFDEDQIRALTAYVYYLAGEGVPDALWKP